MHDDAPLTTLLLLLLTRVVAQVFVLIVKGLPLSAVRVAVLYSGRWFGERLSRVWIAHHLEFLIRPNWASVFVVADAENWCEAPDETREALAARTPSGRRRAEEMFRQEVRAAWRGWEDVHAALLPDAQTQGPRAAEFSINQKFHSLNRRLNASHGIKMGHYLCELMVRWFNQYEHVGRAIEISKKHGRYDWLVSARLDMVLSQTLDLQDGRAAITTFSRTRARCCLGTNRPPPLHLSQAPSTPSRIKRCVTMRVLSCTSAGPPAISRGTRRVGHGAGLACVKPSSVTGCTLARRW